MSLERQVNGEWRGTIAEFHVSVANSSSAVYLACLLRIIHGKEFPQLEGIVAAVAQLVGDPLPHVCNRLVEALPARH